MKSEIALAQIKLLAPELDSAGIRAAVDGLLVQGFARAVRKQTRGNHGGYAITRKTLLALAETFAENSAASFRSAVGEAIDKLVARP